MISASPLGFTNPVHSLLCDLIGIDFALVLPLPHVLAGAEVEEAQDARLLAGALGEEGVRARGSGTTCALASTRPESPLPSTGSPSTARSTRAATGRAVRIGLDEHDVSRVAVELRPLLDVAARPEHAARERLDDFQPVAGEDARRSPPGGRSPCRA